MPNDAQQGQERRINLKIPEELHVRLKIQAARERKTLQDLVAAWLEERVAQVEASGRGA